MVSTMQRIPAEIYKKILENVPIPCVDLVVHHKGKVLLLLRNDEPAKGKWWLPGGRVHKNEKLKDAAFRKVREETGLNVSVEKRIGVYETMFGKSPFGTGVHNVTVGFLVKVTDKKLQIRLDRTSKNFRWIDNLEEDLDPYVRMLIRDARVF